MPDLLQEKAAFLGCFGFSTGRGPAGREPFPGLALLGEDQSAVGPVRRGERPAALLRRGDEFFLLVHTPRGQPDPGSGRPEGYSVYRLPVPFAPETAPLPPAVTSEPPPPPVPEPPPPAPEPPYLGPTFPVRLGPPAWPLLLAGLMLGVIGTLLVLRGRDDAALEALRQDAQDDRARVAALEKALGELRSEATAERKERDALRKQVAEAGREWDGRLQNDLVALRRDEIDPLRKRLAGKLDQTTFADFKKANDEARKETAAALAGKLDAQTFADFRKKAEAEIGWVAANRGSLGQVIQLHAALARSLKGVNESDAFWKALRKALSERFQ